MSKLLPLRFKFNFELLGKQGKDDMMDFTAFLNWKSIQVVTVEEDSSGQKF